MNLIQYNYEDQTQLTPHFKASEWRCKCGRIHSFFVADTLESDETSGSQPWLYF